MLRFWLLLTLSVLCLPSTLFAKTLVLVHGFQSNGMSWRMSGVTPVLQQVGWRDGGNFLLTSMGSYNPMPHLGAGAENVFYTVDLPSRAPVALQASLLDTHLQQIYQHRQEPLVLVGHSADGVVARHWLVTTPSVPVDTLITIATPHLGSLLANIAERTTDSMLGTMADKTGLGKWTKDAENVYRDLRREKPGRFLYWLNHQPHPPLRYVSIVRDNQPRPDQFDVAVPRYSQNMNNVFALHGVSEVVAVKGEHFTGVADGYALARLLAQ